MMDLCLFWTIAVGFRLYLRQCKYIDLYMSSIHSTIAPILYYPILKYKDNLIYDFVQQDYNHEIVKNIISFSFFYFLFDTFIVEDIQYKLHHLITLCAFSSSIYTGKYLMIGAEYLFYAEYPVLLYNYINYMERSNKKYTYPLCYKSLAILHWIAMIHSRVYYIGKIGYNCILYLDKGVCYYILMTVHTIIYTASVDWVCTRYKYLTLL